LGERGSLFLIEKTLLSLWELLLLLLLLLLLFRVVEGGGLLVEVRMRVAIEVVLGMEAVVAGSQDWLVGLGLVVFKEVLDVVDLGDVVVNVQH